jgi:hypothetical protein
MNAQVSTTDNGRRERFARLALRGAWVLPLAVIAALLTAHAAPTFDPNLQPTGWVSRPAMSSFNVSSGNETVFRTGYDASYWSGSLEANDISAQGDTETGSVWQRAGKLSDAGLTLELRIADASRPRFIVTRNDITNTGVGFAFGNLSPSQQTSLQIGTDTTTGAKVVNFVRGDRSNEKAKGGTFRDRNRILGDIQHSTLLHHKHADGKTRLYVGANDGMLHVFDAANGEEVFAYVPSMVVPNLKKLTADPYVHTLFADGPLSIGGVRQTNGTVSTLLVGGLGGGGRGLFALDLSDTAVADEAAAAAKIKWEVSNSSSGFANLGYTYAMPRLARLNNGTAAVVVGNGYMSTTGKATLMLIDANTGALIRELDTNTGSTTSPNGLSSPTLVDTDFDGRVDYAYAGDLDGNLWRFNLTGSNASAYSVSSIALDSSTPKKSITVAPVVYPHPSGGRMVVVATGRMLLASDASDTSAHFVFGAWDGAPAANDKWLQQSLSELTTSTGQKLRWVSANVPVWAAGAGNHRGWRLALPAGAERVVGESPMLNEDRYSFVSSNPTVPAPAIDKPPATGWLQEVSMLSGGGFSAAIFDINNDAIINASDNINGQVIVGKYLGEGLWSQGVIIDKPALSSTIVNRGNDLALVTPTPPSNDRGVSGGHFDVDIYHWAGGSTYANRKHQHEYDDLYDVTGVNFLAPSQTEQRFSNAITNASVEFKVLAINQFLNPASKISIGGNAHVSIRDYPQPDKRISDMTSATDVLNALPNFNRNKVATFEWKLPLDAFKSKNWWGDGGDIRAGLMPTQTGCVNKISSGTTGATTTPGLNGERFNGSMTFQVIKATTPATALELNYPAGGPKYGWRVKAAEFKNYVLMEYTLFWHHPNGKCYNQSGWVKNPPEDLSPPSTKTATPASGADDPKDGAFTLAGGDGVTLINKTITEANGVTTITYYYSDGSTAVQVIEGNRVTTTAGGQTTVTVLQLCPTGCDDHLIQKRAEARRLNWREVVPR